MFGAGGKWMVSSVTEAQVKRLRKAGYLSKDIPHRLPEVGQLLPTPRPNERVVFLSHFLRRLGFPLHPFARGLMFYYGLDFHDLAPNFVLNVSAFIVVCEAFLRIHPHFSPWLKTFNVKPKVVSGTHAECGGAMVGKMANVLWFDGSLVESLKGWQAGWFYITEPRDPKWVAAPEFRSGPPTRLMSWKETGMSWGNEEEVTGLQTCIQSLVNKPIQLANIVQVMLVRLILPCQERDFTLWEFDPAQHQNLSRLFDTTYEDVWKVLTKGAESPTSASEDRGYSSQRIAGEVSYLYL